MKDEERDVVENLKKELKDLENIEREVEGRIERVREQDHDNEEKIALEQEIRKLKKDIDLK